MSSEDINVITIEHEGEQYDCSITQEEFIKLGEGDQELANTILKRELERRDRLMAFKIWQNEAKKNANCQKIAQSREPTNISVTQPSCSKEINICNENVFESSSNPNDYADDNDVNSSLSNRWSDNEVKLLLELYRANAEKFKDRKYRPKAIFADIAKHFERFTEAQIEIKIKNLKKTYKGIVDNNKTTGRGRIAWPYFQKMNEIFGADPENEPISLASNVLGVIHANESNDTEHEEQHPRKRPRTEPAEPVWFRSFREEAAQRHQERMEMQNRFLNIFEKWVNKE